MTEALERPDTQTLRLPIAKKAIKNSSKAVPDEHRLSENIYSQ